MPYNLRKRRAPDKTAPQPAKRGPRSASRDTNSSDEGAPRVTRVLTGTLRRARALYAPGSGTPPVYWETSEMLSQDDIDDIKDKLTSIPHFKGPGKGSGGTVKQRKPKLLPDSAEPLIIGNGRRYLLLYTQRPAVKPQVTKLVEKDGKLVVGYEVPRQRLCFPSGYGSFSLVEVEGASNNKKAPAVFINEEE